MLKKTEIHGKGQVFVMQLKILLKSGHGACVEELKIWIVGEQKGFKQAESNQSFRMLTPPHNTHQQKLWVSI